MAAETAAVQQKSARKPLVGREKPRIAPPTPARSRNAEFEETAETLGIQLMPWQKTVGRYLYATGPDDRWLYPEVANVVARQNGKTEQLVPHIITRLRMGRKIMHTAQDRTLPREVFERVVDEMQTHFWKDISGKPRLANGQEHIRTRNGGRYRIVAPTRGGARGPSNDDLIVDEVREMRDQQFMAAGRPTLFASQNPQTFYLSNAGDEESIVLNAIRNRSDTDPALAYLEWSASPGRPSDDIEGWLESNPALGHMAQTMENLTREHNSHKLAGTFAIFETEHLCRWVTTMRERLVEEYAWSACAAELPSPTRPALAVSACPEGTRADAALAWRLPGGKIALQMVAHRTGAPVDIDAFADEIRKLVARYGVRQFGFDPLTDAAIAKLVKRPKPEPISGQKFSNASARFVNLVNGEALQWADAAPVADDLTWTARKPDDETGSYQAVRSKDDRPITASLAAIRAVWLASGPTPAKPRVM